MLTNELMTSEMVEPGLLTAKLITLARSYDADLHLSNDSTCVTISIPAIGSFAMYPNYETREQNIEDAIEWLMEQVNEEGLYVDGRWNQTETIVWITRDIAKYEELIATAIEVGEDYMLEELQGSLQRNKEYLVKVQNYYSMTM
jgi:hypothetical protein